jgi:hypothetical protein
VYSRYGCHGFFDQSPEWKYIFANVPEQVRTSVLDS